jgi:hypothetical protein
MSLRATLNTHRELLHLTLLYTTIVILVSPSLSPLSETILFFTSLLLHSSLLAYSKHPPAAVCPRKTARQRWNGMKGVIMLSHGKEKPVRVHGLVNQTLSPKTMPQIQTHGEKALPVQRKGTMPIGGATEAVVKKSVETKLLRIEIEREAQNYWKRVPKSPHFVHVRTW